MIHTIITPTRPQPDTLVALYIMKTYGTERFPGVADARVDIVSLPPTGSEIDLEQQGILLFDLGHGRFDHHGKHPVTTCSFLVAQYLGVDQDPSLKKLLDYAYRDDTQGKGTISRDPLDRAFGLSGLVAALNKKYPDDHQIVISVVLHLLGAHHEEEYRRFHEFPVLIQELTDNKLLNDLTVSAQGKNIKTIFVVSDNYGLPGYLRSQIGGSYDLVIQKTSRGHVNILTRNATRTDLSKLAQVVRAQELASQGKPNTVTSEQLSAHARITEVPEWYYDPATNSLQNGGTQPGTIAPTHIPWEAFPELVKEAFS